MRELDACGIGFVADVEGRSSRSIVEMALDGLARVKHRGALAADARTTDGCGFLAPIPAAIFGEGTGVAVLFVRGDDPRAGSTRGAGGAKASSWSSGASRRPTTACSATSRCAPDPRCVHVVFRDPNGETDESSAYRLRRRIERATDRRLRRVVLVPHHRVQGPGGGRRPGRLLPRPGRRALRHAVRRLPPALLHQHAAHLGAGPAVPHALPQRRDQHRRGNANRMRARRFLGTERRGPRPRGRTSIRCSIRRTPTRASSTRRSSCWCAAAGTCATPWPW